MDIEKGDVDISNLFRWEVEVPIMDGRGEEVAKVYMRLLGDKDVNQARVYGLRASAELRKKLRTKGTDEHVAFISEIPTRDRDAVEAGIKLLRLTDLANIARRNAVVQFPKEPDSEATLEEQEKYQQEVDEFPEKYAELVEEELEKLVKQEDKNLAKMKVADLRNEYTETMIEYVCKQEMDRKFMDQTVFFATYKDREYKKKAFKTFEEYENSSTEVKDQLKTAYNDLELGISELKKSPEVTP
jgi:hypothetical protein